MDKLSTLFVDGTPSNHLSLAGLLVHCFDQTEDPQELWKPCTSGYCKQFGGWWSASIINTKQHNTYGGSGIIMSPKYTKVLCSHWADMGTMENGCNVTADHDAADVIADRLESRDRDIEAEKEWHKSGEDEREEVGDDERRVGQRAVLEAAVDLLALVGAAGTARSTSSSRCRRRVRSGHAGFTRRSPSGPSWNSTSCAPTSSSQKKRALPVSS